jgi:hypothetical protein
MLIVTARWSGLGNLLLLLLPLLNTAYASEPAHLPSAKTIRVTAIGFDPDNSATVCKGFSLSRAEVARILATSRVITPHELHYDYDQAPCYVRGTARVGRQQVSWEIRAAGTAWVKFSDGKVVLLADGAQKAQQQ